ELHQQVLAGDALHAVGLLEVEAELPLEQAVDALHLLLLAQLQAVAEAAAAAALAVLARRIAALLDRALLLEAAVALEKQLHALPRAQPADGTCIPCHWWISLLRPPPDATGTSPWEDARPGTPGNAIHR